MLIYTSYHHDSKREMCFFSSGFVLATYSGSNWWVEHWLWIPSWYHHAIPLLSKLLIFSLTLIKSECVGIANKPISTCRKLTSSGRANLNLPNHPVSWDLWKNWVRHLRVSCLWWMRCWRGDGWPSAWLFWGFLVWDGWNVNQNWMTSWMDELY